MSRWELAASDDWPREAIPSAMDDRLVGTTSHATDRNQQDVAFPTIAATKTRATQQGVRKANAIYDLSTLLAV